MPKPRQRVCVVDGRLGYISHAQECFVAAVNFMFTVASFIKAPRYSAVGLKIRVNGILV